MTTNDTVFCVYEDCDQSPTYCAGHFHAEVQMAERLNVRVQSANELIRELLLEVRRLKGDEGLTARAIGWLNGA